MSCRIVIDMINILFLSSILYFLYIISPAEVCYDDIRKKKISCVLFELFGDF